MFSCFLAKLLSRLPISSLWELAFDQVCSCFLLLLQRRRIVIEKRAKKDFGRKSVELQQEVECLTTVIAESQLEMEQSNRVANHKEFKNE